jgi:tRNA (guanine-N7-)-methyltransferase
MNIIPSFVGHRSRIKGEKLGVYAQRLSQWEVQTFEEIQAIMTNFEEFEIEIGSGYGDTIAHLAEQNPQKLFLACEVYRDALYSICKKIDEKGIKNIRLFTTDARNFTENLPNEFASAVYLLFPDPWPKARHHKRRIVTQSFFENNARILKNGGTLLIATDSDSYKQHIAIETFKQKCFQWNAKTAADFTQEPKWWAKTKFQRKAVEQGRSSIFLTLNKIN